MDEKERPLKGELVYGVVCALVGGVRGEVFFEFEGRSRAGVVGNIENLEGILWRVRRGGCKRRENRP